MVDLDAADLFVLGDTTIDDVLEIKEQPKLPIRRQLEICADGVRYRFSRSLLTLGVVTLAVAFLMNMLAEGAIVQACKQGVDRKLQEYRHLDRVLTLTAPPDRPEALQRALAGIEADGMRARVLADWMDLDAAGFEALRRECRQAEEVRTWLEGLTLAQRRLLFDTVEAEQVLDLLGDSDRWRRMERGLEQAPSLRAPQSLADVVRARADRTRRLEQHLASLRRSTDAFQAELKDRSFRERLAAAHRDPNAMSEMRDICRRHGVTMSPETLSTLAGQADRAVRTDLLLAALGQSDLAEAWRGEFLTPFELDAAVAALAEGTTESEWLVARLPDSPDAAELREIATAYRRTHRAEELSAQLQAEYGDEEGLGSNTRWLLVMAFLVCVAGISNAMLVSVLERFREIATMKCLGAMHGLIAALFLMEAGFLGLVGGVIGATLGLLIGMARMVGGLGSWIGEFLPWGGLFGMMGISVLAGLLLTMVSAAYPAIRAARMAPMEAMRVE